VIDFYSDEELDRLYAIITRGVTASTTGDAAIPVGAESGTEVAR
jgi:hypothetical protein